MRLSEVIRAECIQTGVHYEDKAIAFCEISSLAKKSPHCKSITEEAILDALQERETLGTTAFGHGIAIPHCRLEKLQEFVVGVVTVPEGMDFEASDGKKVQLIVFILAPADRPTAHIRLLSSISRALQNEDALSKLLACKSADALEKTMVQLAGPDIRTDIPSEKSLLHVFIQDEMAFQDILAGLSGIETISMVISEGQSAQPILSQIPLYAEFKKNGDIPFCKVIMAVVEKRLSNEIIRRIETVTGPLLECSGVLVTLQDLGFSAGTL